MSFEIATLTAILAMALASALMRITGLLLVRHVRISAHMQQILSAIPPAVLMAVVAPTALATGMAETIACIVTALAALRLPLLGATFLGVACVAVLRMGGL
ncbi:AzlD domain-containing protein [Brucella sp. BE17]|uniref:AzlD family protein n=1 Tax=Brucella sp. BE17 TaxID=3142977 RepID=UPI0031BA4EDB